MATTKVYEVTKFLESIAPKSLQESYDNSGLLTGNPDWDVSGVLVALDCIEQTLDEALRLRCNVVVAHHPIIFKGLKKLTGQSYVERTVIKAIKNDIAIYAIHTNLDNVHTGVNRRIAERIGLTNVRILKPKKETLLKLVTFVPDSHTTQVIDALHEAGAGSIGNYDRCSFQIKGTGTFRPNEAANPHTGTKGKVERAEEIRVEVLFPLHSEKNVLSALRRSHPYEEVAYYVSKLENENQEIGAGAIGELPEALEPMEFLRRLKIGMKTACIRHTATGKAIRKVAVCGGAGSFLLPEAISAGADVFVSGDFKYHEFFDADGRILIADIGHYESEQFTKDLLQEVLKEKFPNFAVNFSETVSNPISYL